MHKKIFFGALDDSKMMRMVSKMGIFILRNERETVYLEEDTPGGRVKGLAYTVFLRWATSSQCKGSALGSSSGTVQQGY